MSLVSLNETHPPHALFTPTQETSYCARWLLGFAADHTQITLSPSDEKLKANFQKNFGFWNWLMHFLFKERTDEGIQDLFERWNNVHATCEQYYTTGESTIMNILYMGRRSSVPNESHVQLQLCCTRYCVGRVVTLTPHQPHSGVFFENCAVI